MLATDDFLRAKLRLSARAAVEAASWEKVILRFEADLLQATGRVEAPATEAVPA